MIHSKIKRTQSRGLYIFLLVLLIGLIGSFDPVQAIEKQYRWRPQRTYSNTYKLLKPRQIKSITKTLAYKALSHPFFTKEVLPRRVSLSRFSYTGPGKMNGELITNFVLNYMINNTKVLIMNQDMQVDIKTNYHLSRYLNKTNTRKRGLYLGSDYVVSGSFKEEYTLNSKNKWVRRVFAKLKVTNLISDELVLEVDITKQK